ncbi:variable large family protein [Borrelia coriaceae]|uniref:variable large family protein n=1 Tax=Borrelia coriaceae TaxID=144 RepID=UPI0006877808|nr:variable large family protein [Borrelia coriaceae]
MNIKNIKVKSICATLFISLFLSCNNGIEELEKKNQFLNSIANLGKGFLSVFTALGDMVTDTLGIKTDTTKDAIGKYFTNIATTMKSVKEQLNAIMAENGNYAKVKEKVNEFIKTIEKIEEGAKTAAGGARGSDAIGGATKSGQDAASAKKDSVNLIVNGLKAIVGVVLDSNEGNPTFDRTTGSEKVNIGKIFSGVKGSDGKEVQAAAANASIGAVSGADILKAISKSGEATSSVAINTATDAASVAACTTGGAQTLSSSIQKDAVIAAGIALRAMAEGGKFASDTTDAAKAADAINGAAASAVNKTLNTLVIAIRNTVDGGLKTISETLTAVKQGDVSAETSESVATK